MAIKAEFHSLICPPIAWIIDLIEDNDSDVRQACVGLLVKFLEQGKMPNLSGLNLLCRGYSNKVVYLF